MAIILISAAFVGAALIRGEALVRERRFFQCGYPKVRRLKFSFCRALFKRILAWERGISRR